MAHKEALGPTSRRVKHQRKEVHSLLELSTHVAARIRGSVLTPNSVKPPAPIEALPSSHLTAFQAKASLLLMITWAHANNTRDSEREVTAPVLLARVPQLPPPLLQCAPLTPATQEQWRRKSSFRPHKRGAVGVTRVSGSKARLKSRSCPKPCGVPQSPLAPPFAKQLLYSVPTQKLQPTQKYHPSTTQSRCGTHAPTPSHANLQHIHHTFPLPELQRTPRTDAVSCS